MQTPFIENLFSIVEDPVMGLSGELYIARDLCSRRCRRCRIKDIKSSRMDVDTLIREIMRYKLMGAESIRIRGGEPLNSVGYIAQNRGLFEGLNVVVMTGGGSGKQIEKLGDLVYGVVLDIKVPYMKVSQWEMEVEGVNLDGYKRTLEESIEVLEKMSSRIRVYYRSSPWSSFSEEAKESIRERVRGLKNNLIIDGRLEA